MSETVGLTVPGMMATTIRYLCELTRRVSRGEREREEIRDVQSESDSSGKNESTGQFHED